MRYIFRKYISNRGSALFMVISTMTALMVSCMAMYFSMVSARASQYAVFNQMQTKQTSQSIADVIKVSMSPDNNSEQSQALRDLMYSIEIGKSISTGNNGFASLDPALSGLDGDQDQIGAYSVTIYRLEENLFDIIITSSVGGSRDSTHFTLGQSGSIEYDPAETGDGGGGDAELFAATGYVPNDAYIDGGYYLTDVFYDTQFTYMNVYHGSGENRIGQNLSTGGDLMLGAEAMTVVHSHSGDSISDEDVNKIGPVTWAIRGNFYPQVSSDFGMRGGSQVLVGGDMTFSPNGSALFYVKNDGYNGPAKLDDHICVYVNGDLNYSGADLKNNIWFFVNGKVNNIGLNTPSSNVRLFVTKGYGDDPDMSPQDKVTTPGHRMTVEEWPKSGDFAYGLNYDQAMELLGQKTQTIDYYKWDISKNTETSDTQHVDIRINTTNSPYNGLEEGEVIPANQSTFIFAYKDGESNVAQSAEYIEGVGANGKEKGVVGKSFIIDSVLTHNDNDNPPAIIIDTGDDPNNIMTIKLSDVTGDGGFSWFVDREGDQLKTCLGIINNNMRLVLLKGRGTVLIDVPSGITYRDSGGTMTGHVAWWLIEGGKITNNDGHLRFNGPDPRGKYSAKLLPYVHRDCNTGDGCNISTSTSTVKCSACGQMLTQVTCEIHGDVNKYCENCHPENKDRKDWCKNHIDKKKFEEFYNTLSGEEKAAVTGKDGNIVYPSVNFMLVSCDESAEMLFTEVGTYQYATYNTLFGFIYAPYMSYLAAGGEQGGGLVKLVGGMTVGDYDIRAINAYIGCYPDKMPNELAGMNGGGSIAGGKLSGATKSWKIEVGGYY